MEKLVDRISLYLFQHATTDLRVKVYLFWVRTVASRFNKDLTTPNS